MSNTLKQLNSTSKALAKSLTGWNAKAHTHLVNIGQFIAETGNVTPLTDFVNLIGGKYSSVRTNAIKAYAEAYLGARWSAENKFGKIKGFEFDRAEAEAVTFWTFTPEAEFKPVDALALITAAIKKIEKARDDAEHKGEHKNCDNDLINALNAVVSKRVAAAA